MHSTPSKRLAVAWMKETSNVRGHCDLEDSVSKPATSPLASSSVSLRIATVSCPPALPVAPFLPVAKRDVWMQILPHGVRRVWPFVRLLSVRLGNHWMRRLKVSPL